MSSASSLLLRKQLNDLNKNGTEGFSAGLIDDDNIFRWQVLIMGPADTIYDGGCFKALLEFPQDYPNRPPKMQFITDMWHPNISATGNVCISILHDPGEDRFGYERPEERWLPVHTVESIIMSVISMLAEPNPDSPANVDAAGNISESDPRLACDNVTPPPLKGVFFALADRGKCDFVVKVLSIQKANYLGAIIINTESDYVFPMGSDKNLNISIPAIMIGNTSGFSIRQHYLYDKHFLAKMTPNPGTSIEYYLVPLLITLSLAFLGIIIFLGIRVLRNCLRQSKNRLSRDILNKLPEIRFSEDYQSLYDTCAICLEDYVIGDKLRVLPCHHAYHSKCVDRWLLRRQRSCPVCKYRIHRTHDEQDSDTDDPHQAAGEGPSGSGTATVEQSSRSRAGIQEHPEFDASMAYENADTENDIAPLLSKSAPVASWLSGGQLPQQGSTWLGYGEDIFFHFSVSAFILKVFVIIFVYYATSLRCCSYSKS
ncbi:unnamed protein product [Rodentolepis nana]|uniref:E2 ubiquitin-conjugating enzyme n=1 Tax=Rodentolepis nana TaxID=102285 RepID=A0A0R3TJG3_RODNA|nr:unnamed protein product [Rodentolepis nana]